MTRKPIKNSETSSENLNNGLLPISLPTVKKSAVSRLNRWKTGSKTNDQREIMPAKNTKKYRRRQRWRILSLGPTSGRKRWLWWRTGMVWKPKLQYGLKILPSYDTGSLTDVGGSIWSFKPRITLLTTEWLRFFGEEDPQAGGDVQETPEEDFEEHYTVFRPLRWRKSAQTIGYASFHEPCCLTRGDICFLLSWRYYDHEQKVTRQFGRGQWTTVVSRDWSHSRPEESKQQTQRESNFWNSATTTGPLRLRFHPITPWGGSYRLISISLGS